MTTVGHSLTGIAIAALTLPQAQTRRWYFFIGAGFVFFANLPDYPLPGWGHNSYLVSHSIFVTALLAALLGLLLLWPTFQAGVGKRVLVAWSAAWFSHMLLDSMYNHGQGIAIFWPWYSSRRRSRIFVAPVIYFLNLYYCLTIIRKDDRTFYPSAFAKWFGWLSLVVFTGMSLVLILQRLFGISILAA